ncbi:WD40-repeat-containing domain protein [Aspergillus pseudonomiae]|uniref:Serine-threonine kinase receptor-associated protein n=3 Tax=Aspergillus TaxID=5052 RepID=A0A0L1JCB5_ASPN3|nr:WD repeat protein [Aspergillus nomiae NRRL 13137]XP_022383374.1 WD repeat protein [Aspergillus bombycis]XP_031934454.1 WD40-repeat-containing domain protein [Aspergillus pseudonomiae]KAB8253871.1 WD40-repeat-containing domain protein [Aspergillus pseudonomiae]KAE8397135.1 WD40-repeat-containing domain protein [Aspergillus pseudonomiae]KNG89372.1 WD repeat protein [Aspergillus nomiae NRRL 13137]OGM39657.1 WD repeat protein [Aspergillus bombycis]
MASDLTKVVPLTCHGHSRPVPHIDFSSTVEDDQYYLISACKDNNPMLRDGITGDWIGTFLGHKGAVWQARLSTDATIAATAAADFSAKVWDTHTGECLHTLQHSHIVRAVAFPMQPSPQVLATGGFEKKLRIFDLSRSNSGSNSSSPTFPASTGENGTGVTSYEIGPGVHGGTIKSIVWNQDYNILTTAAEDRKIRWWDLRSRHPVIEYTVEGTIGSCELNTLAVRPNDPGILTVAAGKSVYLFDGSSPGRLLKKTDFRYEVASAAVNNETGRLVTGSADDTWARVYDLRTDEELEVQKGHHGPIWSVSFSPDGKLYGTGSEDGTIKLWKACREPYGLWR